MKNLWLALCSLLVMLVWGFGAEAKESTDSKETEWVSWRAIARISTVASIAAKGELGYIAPGDQSQVLGEASFRLQAKGKLVKWANYQADYLNVLHHGGMAPGTSLSGAALYRRQSWRKMIEEPGLGSSQQVWWSHELDRAQVRFRLPRMEAILGRQPIGFGAGRIWQPLDLFASFSPLTLEREFKPGVDALVVRGSPGDFSSLTFARVLSPAEQPLTPPSSVVHFRGKVGEESEVTLLWGRVRDEMKRGGSFETAFKGFGLRIEGVTRIPDDGTQATSGWISGVDRVFGGGWNWAMEWYQNSLGADWATELPGIMLSTPFAEGRMRQLSGQVLGNSFSWEFLGLWRGSYMVFTSGLKDTEGVRKYSFLQQMALIYSLSDEAQAVMSLSGGSGGGLNGSAEPTSEFGHIPNLFSLSMQFYL